MAFTPISPTEIIVENDEISKEQLASIPIEQNKRLGNLPDNYSAYTNGEAVVLGDDGLGPIPASDGVEPVVFAGRELGYFKANRVRVGGSGFAMNDREHCGRLLVKSDGDAAIVSFDASAEPANGVSDGFQCALWRQLAAGALEVRSTSFANDHPNGHRAVRAGGLATLIVDAETNVFRLIGETE